MLDPILVRLKRELVGKQGIVILNGALLAESRALYLCNNNVILVSCQKKIQEDRLKKRGLTMSQISRRIKSQYSFDQKKQMIGDRIAADKNGKLWVIDSSRPIETRKIAGIIEYAKGLLGCP
jgi:dephospho-CoA kinase